MTFDLGDEIGRQNLKAFISNILSTRILDEMIIQKLVKCVENLIPDSNVRLQFFIDIVRSIIDPTSSIDITDKSLNAIIDGIKDPNVRIEISAIKLKLLDLREQETNASQQKDYARLEKITEELVLTNEGFVRLVNDSLQNDQSLKASFTEMNSSFKKLTAESTGQCLQICFYAVASKHTQSLTPSMCQLYKVIFILF